MKLVISKISYILANIEVKEQIVNDAEAFRMLNKLY
jgi:hypothetical protein